MYKFTKLNRGQKTLSIEDIADWTNVMKLAAEFRKILFDDNFYGIYSAQSVSCNDLDTEGACFEFTKAVEDLVSGAGRNFWIVKKRAQAGVKPKTRDERGLAKHLKSDVGRRGFEPRRPQEQKRANRCGCGEYKRDEYGRGREYSECNKCGGAQEPIEWAFAGFIYLYGFYGKGPKSAYVGCCFKREFWGGEALKIGRKFIKYCFSHLSIHKLKCETMRSNPYVAGFLKRLGFKLEGVLEDDTFVGGKPESLMLWGLRGSNFFDSEGLRQFRPASAGPKTPPSNGCGSDSNASCPAHDLRAKKRTLRVPDYTSRSINNKVIVADFSCERKKD